MYLESTSFSSDTLAVEAKLAVTLGIKRGKISLFFSDHFEELAKKFKLMTKGIGKGISGKTVTYF